MGIIMMIFHIMHEKGQGYAHSITQLRSHLSQIDGHVMIRYTNLLGQPSTLFLTVEQGVAFQRFRIERTEFDWDWFTSVRDNFIAYQNNSNPEYPDID